MSKLEEDLSFDDAEKIVERAGLTSSANKTWKGYLKNQEKERKSKEKKLLESQLDMVDVESGRGELSSDEVSSHAGIVGEYNGKQSESF